MSHDRSPDISTEEIPAGWTLPSDLYGWGAVLKNALPYFAVLALAPLLAQRKALSPWLLSPVIGLLGYRITLVMHDCIHRTLFQDPDLNDRVGATLGAITGIDFHRFSSQHRRHHQQVGQVDDPQGFHYLEIGALTPCERLWHLFKPLAGLNLRYALPDSFLSPSNLTRALGRGEGLLIAGAQVGIALLVTGGGRHLTLALLPLVSAATFGLFLSQLRGIAEHATLEGKQIGYVKTHAPHWLDRMLLYGLNFNYHEEHHRYPHIPSHRLPEVNAALTRGETKQAGSMLQTIARIVFPDPTSHVKSR